MTVGAALLVRAGSALVWIAVGAAVLALGKQRRENLLLGGLVASVGSALLAANLAAALPSAAASLLHASGAANLAAVAAAGGLALAWGRAAPRAAGVAAGLLALAGAAVGVRSAPAVVALYESAGIEAAAVFGLYAPVAYLREGLLAGLVLLLAYRPPGRATTLLALALGLPTAWSAGAMLLSGETFEALFGGLLASLAAGAWLLRARHPGRRTERNVALVLLASPVVGAATLLAAVEVGLDVASIGVVRVVGAALLALALFRHDLLGVPLPSLAARRGSIATLALASLFIVAQIAEQLVSAQFGLVLGGAAAGALLFAANPVQRAIERRAAPPPDLERRERAYLDAVRSALRDRVLTRDEEARLHRLAEELGLGAGRAHELLVAVEREATVETPEETT